MNDIFPQKTYRVTQQDKPWITFELKKLDKLKKREYRKHGKSDKYVKLLEKFDKKYKMAAKEHLFKNVKSLKEENPGKAYSVLKKMGSQPGDCMEEGSFRLLEHIEKNLSDEVSADKIADHFASISQQYPPLNRSNLPTYVQDKMADTTTVLPVIDEVEVWEKISHAKKPKGGVPGDMPKKLLSEFAPELATPMTKIFQNIINHQKWPSMWKTEFGIPLQKVSNPENEDQLRIISLTPFFSKVFEKFVIEWLVHYIGDKIDWRQYGGQKGSSIAHYLIEFITFILYNLDLKKNHAVLAILIDFSKAFNRQDHNILITLLCDMGVPGWLLNIVASFLEDRELVLWYKGCTTKARKLPGGGPQGTVLGMFLFIVLINLIGFQDQEEQLGKILTKPLKKRLPMNNIHLKFVDDMTVAESINVKNQLAANPDTDPQRPLEFHSRTGHILPEKESQLIPMLNEIKEYTESHGMKINHDKSKIILFNTSRKYDFKPALSFGDVDKLPIVESTKLLGITIQSDLKWNTNTDDMCSKAYARIWMLRRLKANGAEVEDLVDVYTKQVRCVLELAVAAWTAGLTCAQVAQIERVQKTACAVILGSYYDDYSSALIDLKLSTLMKRRIDLCITFGRKCIKSEKYGNWFDPRPTDNENVLTRAKKSVLLPVNTRTKRFLKSPIPYLTSLLNKVVVKPK